MEEGRIVSEHGQTTGRHPLCFASSRVGKYILFVVLFKQISFRLGNLKLGALGCFPLLHGGATLPPGAGSAFSLGTINVFPVIKDLIMCALNYIQAIRMNCQNHPLGLIIAD